METQSRKEPEGLDILFGKKKRMSTPFALHKDDDEDGRPIRRRSRKDAAKLGLGYLALGTLMYSGVKGADLGRKVGRELRRRRQWRRGAGMTRHAHFPRDTEAFWAGQPMLQKNIRDGVVGFYSMGRKIDVERLLERLRNEKQVRQTT